MVGGDVGHLEDFAGLAAQLLLGAGLMDDDVALFITLAARLLQLRARHRQRVLRAVQLVSSRLIITKQKTKQKTTMIEKDLWTSIRRPVKTCC